VRPVAAPLTVDSPEQQAVAFSNVGLGTSHVFTPNDGPRCRLRGYTRQVTGAQSTIDIAGRQLRPSICCRIPGTNGVGSKLTSRADLTRLEPATSEQRMTTSAARPWEIRNGANPFLFRDNQFTGDGELSWNKGRHAMKYGFTYYHFPF